MELKEARGLHQLAAEHVDECRRNLAAAQAAFDAAVREKTETGAALQERKAAFDAHFSNEAA